MHPAAIKLTKTIHADYLQEKGYRLVANTVRFRFMGGCVISRLRGCNKYNRDSILPWSFQIDSKILFDDLDFDPRKSALASGPRGSVSEGLYKITKDSDNALAKTLASLICNLTDEFVAKRDVFYIHFQHLMKEKQNGNEGRWVHIPRKLNASELAEVEQWLAKQSKKSKLK